MKRLLDDYIFNERLRYESHRLTYQPENGAPVVLTGMMAAAVLYALLVNTEEGDARGVSISTPDYTDKFFNRYETELIQENGGEFQTEVQALSQTYIELIDDSDNILMHICRNERLYSLAYGLTIAYMQRLVVEQVGRAIYEVAPFHDPFAQWLYDAAFVETRRRQLLAVDWTDAEDVYAIAQMLAHTKQDDQPEPTFYFDGLSADELLNAYFGWLWATVQQQTAVLPNANVQLAELQPEIIEQETNWDFIRPDVRKLSASNRQLFADWMTRWTEFIRSKLGQTAEQTFPEQHARHKTEQVILPDTITPCPAKNKYVAVCDYIHDRCLYDEAFRTYFTTHTRADFCEQLTLLFGWYVNPNHLGKRLKNHHNR